MKLMLSTQSMIIAGRRHEHPRRVAQEAAGLAHVAAPARAAAAACRSPGSESDASATTAAEKTMVSCTTIGEIDVAQDVGEHDAGRPGAERTGGRDIDVLAHGERAAAHDARQDRRLHQPQRQHDVLDVRSQQADERHRQQERREGQEGIDQPHQEIVDAGRRSSRRPGRAARRARRRSPPPAGRPTARCAPP